MFRIRTFVRFSITFWSRFGPGFRVEMRDYARFGTRSRARSGSTVWDGCWKRIDPLLGASGAYLRAQLFRGGDLGPGHWGVRAERAGEAYWAEGTGWTIGAKGAWRTTGHCRRREWQRLDGDTCGCVSSSAWFCFGWYLCALLYQCLWMSDSYGGPRVHPGLSKTLSGCAFEPIRSAPPKKTRHLNQWRMNERKRIAPHKGPPIRQHSDETTSKRESRKVDQITWTPALSCSHRSPWMAWASSSKASNSIRVAFKTWKYSGNLSLWLHCWCSWGMFLCTHVRDMTMMKANLETNDSVKQTIRHVMFVLHLRPGKAPLWYWWAGFVGFPFWYVAFPRPQAGYGTSQSPDE